jgi:mannonate dehydratase
MVYTPMPKGMAWNMVVDSHAPPGNVPSATMEELWQRLEYFLEEILPVAEESGVTMAAHPDDPPCESVGGQPRLVYKPHLYQKLLDLKPHAANALEFCIGSLAEMTEGDIYEAVETYSSQEKIAYIHFRNVRGKVPHYKEAFIDDGDVDMIRVIQILKKNHYTGVLIPDHTPQMTCDAPWHAGMAYALGYLKEALKSLD